MKEEKLSLTTLCGGALQEKVDRALQKVANNILDPNTDPEKKRSITIKLTFKPSAADNEDVDLSTEISVALAPEIGASTSIFVNKDLATGNVTVMEHSRGVIRGQISFGDLQDMEQQEPEAPAAPADPGKEIPEIKDFRKVHFG